MLAGLVALSIILLTGYFGEGSGGFFHGLQRTAQTILSPIETGATRAFKPIRDASNSIGNVFTASGENKRLKSDLANARTQLAQVATAARDNEQFRGLLGLPRTAGFPQEPRLTAQVVVKNPTVWSSTVLIDRGSDDGVQINQPVINGQGLFGRVSATTAGTATVTLITDASSAVSAEVVPGGASGIVTPAVGNPSDLRLQDLLKASSVHLGDTIVTSGFSSGKLESIFPRGIPIGKVTSIKNDELTLYQLVHIQPYADFHRTDYVQVLTARPRVSQAQVNVSAPAGGP